MWAIEFRAPKLLTVCVARRETIRQSQTIANNKVARDEEEEEKEEDDRKIERKKRPRESLFVCPTDLKVIEWSVSHRVCWGFYT